MQRFWDKVNKTDGCWIWTGARNKLTGYGGFQLRGDKCLAHRVAWELVNGPIPRGPGFHGLCVCHRCDNRACVNPDHLFLATQAGNIADRDAKGRRADTHGEKHPSSKLSEADVRAIRSRVEHGERQKNLAREYGVSPAMVCYIVNGKNWKHI